MSDQEKPKESTSFKQIKAIVLRDDPYFRQGGRRSQAFMDENPGDRKIKAFCKDIARLVTRTPSRSNSKPGSKAPKQ